MALKAFVDSLDDVDENLRGLYAERDGKYALTVEGMVPKDRLDEFRNNNLDLKRQIEDMQERFKGIDPETARELATKAAKERDKKLIDAGKVDELVSERVKAMQSDFEKNLKAVSSERDGMRQQLEGLLIDTAIRDAAAKAGVRATAVEDVLLRGRSTFRLVEGKAAAMDGDKQIFGKNGDPVTIDEWVSDLIDRAPHLFEQSQGGGSRQGTGAPALAAGRISRTDQSGILKNLDAIAKGTAKVV